MKYTSENRNKTIFNKNGITIKKIFTNTWYTGPLGGAGPIIYYRKTNVHDSGNNIYFSKSKKTKKTISIQKESPLGFYYTVVEDINTPIAKPEKNSKSIVNVVIATTSSYCYEITYLTEKNGVTVNKETRPWDLVGGSFPDNYITGLLSDLNIIFDEIESCKKHIQCIYDNNYQNYKKDYCTDKTPREIRRIVVNDLFGDPDGIKFQTNEEKIIAHGFDLKTSFRKM